MFPRVSPPSSLIAAALALALPAGAVAQLASKSPFLPAQSAAPAGPTAGAPLQFAGYMSTSEGALYRIHDPAKKTGAWVKLNEHNRDFDVTIKQYDSEQKQIVIEHQGKTLTLAERESKVVSSGHAAQAMPPPPLAQPAAPSNVPAAVTQAVVLNPTPADEAKRLEAVAAEVQRRRALREAATQQVGQGAQPQVQVPQITSQQPGVPPRVTPAINNSYQQQPQNIRR